MKSTKKKLVLNISLLAIILGIIYYVLRNSLSAIFAELASTSPWVLFLTVGLGTLYQFAEGRSIKEIAKLFEPTFSTVAGFWCSCYIAFYRIITFGTGTLVSEVYFYRKKEIKLSQGVGITALHMIMYKAAVITYALIGLILQFSAMSNEQPAMIWLVLIGVAVTLVIIAVLLVLSSSLNLQVLMVKMTHRIIKKERFRTMVDSCNLQIYSLREAIEKVVTDHTALWRIYLWNMVKLAFWYVLPFMILVESHPQLDFLQALSYISFAVIVSGVIPTPAGIGSFEFVYMLLFRPLVGTVDAVSSLLLYRFGSFVLPFIYGFFYVMAERRAVIKTEIQNVKNDQVVD